MFMFEQELFILSLVLVLLFFILISGKLNSRRSLEVLLVVSSGVLLLTRSCVDR